MKKNNQFRSGGHRQLGIFISRSLTSDVDVFSQKNYIDFSSPDRSLPITNDGLLYHGRQVLYSILSFLVTWAGAIGA